MPRSVAAYLSDIVDACAAVEAVLAGVDLVTYQETRAVRSSVEREFILVGEAVAAIHLAEMALAAEPDSRPALEAHLAAHEHLLAERGGRNFWETGWLRHQVARTRSRLG